MHAFELKSLPSKCLAGSVTSSLPLLKCLSEYLLFFLNFSVANFQLLLAKLLELIMLVVLILEINFGQIK